VASRRAGLGQVIHGLLAVPAVLRPPRTRGYKARQAPELVSRVWPRQAHLNRPLATRPWGRGLDKVRSASTGQVTAVSGLTNLHGCQPSLSLARWQSG
jgi:hypothetical protein